eukprot:CAMPEP_0172569228 /NCGR_PEP_ID=MMETSP1067-20121228/122707_1 /TAXON_ID=265564 ORGANISM="Thalassiosira punctigera, Strain Tpunct2005C2" /NCGR_SAMPLE_ID=MMETSP1067 /ASSEMBLY_ACC=CAM_ASM_000444 /LENGTH=60 /DNA_ID=CAMNT_0013361009 /DNA_START=116 /DNA_END=294 /DNA_ORIENTATION=+
MVNVGHHAGTTWNGFTQLFGLVAQEAILTVAVIVAVGLTCIKWERVRRIAVIAHVFQRTR